MYQIDNITRKYTWEKRWNIPYESLWARIEKFRLVNQISIDVDTFGLHSYGSKWCRFDSNYLIYRYGNLKMKEVEEILDFKQIGYGIFVQSEMITDKIIRYCPECIKYGYHSIFHQMRIFDICVFHPHIKLNRICNCGSLSYVLHTKTIKKFPGSQCSGCGAKLPLPTVPEGIGGKWDLRNLEPQISEWSRIWKKRIDAGLYISMLNFNDKDKNPYDKQIYDFYKRGIKEYLFTGKVESTPSFDCIDPRVASKFEFSLANRRRKRHLKYPVCTMINGVKMVAEYAKSNIERRVLIKTFNEIVQINSKTPGHVQYSKNKCDPESAIILFMIKKIKNSTIVVDLTHLSYREEGFKYHDPFRVGIRKIFGYHESCYTYAEKMAFNYLYKCHLESYYNYLKQCFYNDIPCEFPITGKDEVNDRLWTYPAYLIFHNDNAVAIYEVIE